MIIRVPAPRDRKGQADDVLEFVHVYQCSACVKRWHMAEEDDKPEFCPYCGSPTA